MYVYVYVCKMNQTIIHSDQLKNKNQKKCIFKILILHTFSSILLYIYIYIGEEYRSTESNSRKRVYEAPHLCASMLLSLLLWMVLSPQI